MSKSPAKALEGRIAVVTGASRGIGYETAKAYGAAGAHVVAVARTVGGLEELDDEIKAAGGTATLVPLDLSDGDAIDGLGAELAKRWGRIDILLANAGLLGPLSPIGHLDPKRWDEVFNINVTANFRLIRSFDPLLRQSDKARAIFLSSGAAKGFKPFTGLYSASKAALEAMVKTYANENAKASIDAVLVDPGHLRTRMRAQYAPGEDPETVQHPSTIAPSLVDLADPAKLVENGRIFKFPECTWRD